MQSLKPRRPHQTFELTVTEELKVIVSSDFDQGNLESAHIRSITQQQKQKIISIEFIPCLEPFNPQYSNRQSTKTFFNFSVSLLHDNSTIKLGELSTKKFKDIQQLTLEKQNQRENVNDQSSDSNEDYEGWGMGQSLHQPHYNTIQMFDRVIQGNNLSDPVTENVQDPKNCQEQKDLKEDIQASDNKSEHQQDQIIDNQKREDQVLETVHFIFYIRRMNVPNGFDIATFQSFYRPCIGRKNLKNIYEQPNYEKFKPNNMKLIQSNDDYTLKFTFKEGFEYNSKQRAKYFNKTNNKLKSQQIYFAYHYPYNNQQARNYMLDLERDINSINTKANGQKHIYFRNQFLIQSVEGRSINLLTLTQLNQDFDIHQCHKSGQIILNLPREPRMSQNLFPFYQHEDRPYKFHKPYAMLTCRVHPGQSSASFALQGIINSLLDGSEQSEFLLKSFTFVIIPILNSDGVYNGTYRMDPSGHNLNRFYDVSLPQKHPSIFGAQTLIRHYSSEVLEGSPNNLAFFMDLHAHAKLTTPFFYGNAYPSLLEQTETQLFNRLIEKKSQHFAEGMSSFSQKNMNSKDAVQLMNKSGSARLCAFRAMKGFIHCYTLQMGYIGCIKNFHQNSQQLLEENSVKKEQLSPTRIITKARIFDKTDYRESGAAIMKNLASIYSSSFLMLLSTNNSKISIKKKYIQDQFQFIREQLGKELYNKEERLRMRQNLSGNKLKNMNVNSLNSFFAKLIKFYPSLQQCTRLYILGIQIKSNTMKNVQIERIQNELQLELDKKNCRSLTPIYTPYNKQIEQNKQKKTNFIKILKESSHSEILKRSPEEYKYNEWPPIQIGLKEDDKQDNREQEHGKIFKKKISITPIKFNVQKNNKKFGRQTNIRKMIEFYSNPISEEQGKKIRAMGKQNKQMKIKIIPGERISNPKQIIKISKAKVRQSCSENKTTSTNIHHNQHKKPNKNYCKVKGQILVNSQLNQEMKNQGFSFNFLHDSESEKKIQNTQKDDQMQAIKGKQTISYDMASKKQYRKKNTQKMIKTPQKKTNDPHRIVKTPNSAKQTPSYLLSCTDRFVRTIKTRETIKTPSSSFGYAYNDNGIIIETKTDCSPDNRSRQQIVQWKSKNAFLPKLQLLRNQKTHNTINAPNIESNIIMNNKYEVQLKIKQNYDKKYNIQDIKNNKKSKDKEGITYVNMPNCQ